MGVEGSSGPLALNEASPETTGRGRPPGVVALPADFRACHQLYRAAYVRWAEIHLGSGADAEEAVDHAF